LTKLRQTMLVPGAGTGWAPTVDGRIVPDYPFDTVAPAVSAHVPLLTGTCMNEAALLNLGHPEKELLTMEELNQKVVKRYGDNNGVIVEAYRRAHPSAKPAVLWELILSPRTNAVSRGELKTALGAAPAYLYWFTWQSPVLDGRLRAFHGSDVPFVWDNTDRCSHMTGGGEQARELAVKISNAWVSFARNGDPNHSGIPKWPVFTVEKGETMILNDKCEVQNDPDRAERKILESATTTGLDLRNSLPEEDSQTLLRKAR